MLRKAAAECLRCLAFLLGPALDVSHGQLPPGDPGRLSVRTMGALEALKYAVVSSLSLSFYFLLKFEYTCILTWMS